MTPYQRQKQKRRTAFSFLAAFLFHILIFAAVVLYDYLFVEDLSDYSGPVLVKLGEPEGADLPVLPDENVPKSEDVPETSTPPEPQQDSDALPDSPSVSAPEPVSDTAQRPAPVETLQEITDTSTTRESSSEETPAETRPEVPVQPRELIIEGSEAGNSWETRYDSGGLVGRSLGAAIFLYMPLPRYLSADIFNRIEGDSYSPGTSRQEFLLRYYKEINQEFVLEYEPVTDDVRAIWDYIIKAGYDLEQAEYKVRGYLKPVILTFSISSGGELVNMEVYQSSGDPRVDAAVAEGFQNAAFYNSEGREINGRFTYRFQ